MSIDVTTEKRFEADIEEFFLSPAGGYTHNNDVYDPQLGVYKDTLLRFIQRTQPKEWKRFLLQNKVDPERKFCLAFNNACDMDGLISVLRHRVMLGALHDKLIADDKLASSARTSDPRIFTESIFPSAFGNAAMESYMEAQDSYGSLFEDKSKYDAVMSALAGVIYREMRSKKTVDYRKIERDEQVQMVAEEPVKYGE